MGRTEGSGVGGRVRRMGEMNCRRGSRNRGMKGGGDWIEIIRKVVEGELVSVRKVDSGHPMAGGGFEEIGKWVRGYREVIKLVWSGSDKGWRA